ncbi:bifunctional phosphoribosylaminoimidazolecarboxamide formyltransferase/IMP cyclohydrolase PurH [Alicyclobacillaceae bacterium I2511]|nr:bifunctional phosphoribosylaminoimidazolecarboxamide formyltransferase/IMP cyclohydrolase PurH [Alicyclobacillaceae bacterium I2511]
MHKWALVSVYDKQGIVPFCRVLEQAGYGILSTGGTAKELREANVPVTEVEDYTGFPEMLDGRVKTLHPKIHGGVLGVRDNPAHIAAMERQGIEAIDLVVVNLYPFEQTVARPDTRFEAAVEMIDIGGPTLLRAAAKNHRFCLPVVDPADYEWLAAALQAGQKISELQRRELAAKVFVRTNAYDLAIATYLQAHVQTTFTPELPRVDTESAAKDTAESAADWPAVFTLSVVNKQPLRYGENPHQKAHFYIEADASPATLAAAVQLQGKELSYNNIQDADAALRILRDLDDLAQPAVVAVKHMNPCGVGLGDSLDEAFARAYESDSISIFGGIIACNRIVEGALAERLSQMFLEIVIAPGFTDEARKRFVRKKNVRLLTVDFQQPLWRPGDLTFRRVAGGLLVQQVDAMTLNTQEWQVVTQRTPTDLEWQGLRFAWRVVKSVKSNAIVLATSQATTGIGAGQMNRVGAANIAIAQAGAKAATSVLASDAFFPMRDTLDTAAKAGIRAVIQPGGSIKDQDSIDAADEQGVTMVFTGRRHFLH